MEELANIDSTGLSLDFEQLIDQKKQKFLTTSLQTPQADIKLSYNDNYTIEIYKWKPKYWKQRSFHQKCTLSFKTLGNKMTIFPFLPWYVTFP